MSAPGAGISHAAMERLLQEARELCHAARSDVNAAIAVLAPLQPEPLCSVCGEDLHPRDADIGTHVRCDPPGPALPEPLPTLPDLTDALRAYDGESARSLQAAVGPSEIGVECDRRLGYALRNAPEQPGALPWAPIMGTAVHASIAAALTAVNERTGRQRWLVERRVHPDPDLSGSCDAYDTDTDTVIDWKLVGQSTIDKAKRGHPSTQYQVQSHLYGRGWQCAGFSPKFVRIVFLPRASHVIDGAYEWTAPYSRLIAESALIRLREVAELLDHLDVDHHPDRWIQVPATATSDACYFCPHHRSGPDVDFAGCAGYRPASARGVDDYLATLPTK